MSPFFSRCYETAMRETRSLTVLPPTDLLPQGKFMMTEFYCDAPGCDCRRAIIRIHRTTPGDEINRPVATLTFGWEPPEFYQAWMGKGATLEDVKGMSGLGLELMSPQTSHCDAFLSLIRDHVLTEPGFIDRLKRHYAEFRATLAAEPAKRPRTIRPGAPGGCGVKPTNGMNRG